MIVRAFAVAVLLCFRLGAQISVSGALLDPSNTPVSGVSIVLKQREEELSTLTSATGQFRFDSIRPGSYDLLISVSGFDPVRHPVRVGAQPIRPITIRLRLATFKEELTVEAQDRQVSVAPGQNADAISVERTMLDNLPMLDNNYLTALARFFNPGSAAGANALTGQIAAVNADGIDLKTRTATVKVEFSSKTKFEHDKKAVDESHVKVGDRAGVIGNKLPTGEWMANEVILGLPAPSAAAAPKDGGAKKAPDQKH